MTDSSSPNTPPTARYPSKEYLLSNGDQFEETLYPEQSLVQGYDFARLDRITNGLRTIVCALRANVVKRDSDEPALSSGTEYGLLSAAIELVSSLSSVLDRQEKGDKEGNP